MAFTLTCHVCGQKLKLFTVDIKKRKGKIRCIHCGAPISYDLDSRKIQRSGFWAEKETPFDHKTKNRMLSQIKKADSQNVLAEKDSLPSPKSPDLQINSFHQKPGFAKFDLKTGTVAENKEVPSVKTLPRKPVSPPLHSYPKNHLKQMFLQRKKLKTTAETSWAVSLLQKIKKFWHKLR